VGSLSPWHWAIVAVVVIVLFGAKRLPDAARSLGKSMRIFKSEIHELHADEADAVVAPRVPGEHCRATRAGAARNIPRA